MVVGAVVSAVGTRWVILTGAVATVWASGLGCVTKTPDGGTATGAGGGVTRTPDGGTAIGACATSVGLGVWPLAIDVPASSPTPSARQKTLFLNNQLLKRGRNP
jgi:hypothetical protein